MKKMLLLPTIVVIFLLFSVVCSAEENADKFIIEFEEIVPEGVRSDLTSGEGLQEALEIDEIISEILQSLNRERGKISAFFLTLVGAFVLLALSKSVAGSFGNAASAVVGAVVSVVVFSSVYGIFSTVASAISEANNFFVALIPIAVGITSLGGGVFTAGVQTTGMAVTAAVLSKLWSVAFTSVSGLGLSMALISSYGGRGAESVSRWVKKTSAWILGLVTAAISGTLALQTMVASARDSAAMRAARYASSSMIPVVGSTVSGALSTLASGVSYVKGIVGGGSIFVIISLLISPLVLILLYRLALSFATFLADFFEIQAAQKIFGSFLYSLDTVVAIYTISSIIYIFEIVLFVKSGVALL